MSRTYTIGFTHTDGTHYILATLTDPDRHLKLVPNLAGTDDMEDESFADLAQETCNVLQLFCENELQVLP